MLRDYTLWSTHSEEHFEGGEEEDASPECASPLKHNGGNDRI